MPSCIDEVKDQGWPCIDAKVPGNVELDLCRAGLEEDPFYGNNIYRYRKYEFYQWWFERSFEVQEGFPDEVTILKINGLNTFGTIWINGSLAGSTDNMLVEHEIDVTDILRQGTNHIAIRVESSINKVRERDFPVNIKGNEGHDEFVWLRMCAHAFGWDIAPRLLSAGIWRDIALYSLKKTRIKEVYYAVKALNGRDAELLVKYRFSTDYVYIDGFSVRVHGRCGDHVFCEESKTLFCSGEMSVKVKDARLWWPRGYGEANLYEVTFELLHEGKVVDSRKERIGLRTVDIQARYDTPGQGEFRISVNKYPILAKGTNWCALDALHSRDKNRLKAIHDLADELGCNIIRCWGGNVYEDHDFFSLCDERGIMVWQDFALACGIYPQNDEFAHMIEKECTSIVRKLRNHPSIILWAGDNEVDLLYYDSRYRLPAARYNRISREVLARVVGDNDPFRYYLPSSPYIPEHMTGDRVVPEQHCWGPRDYFKGKYYSDCPASFISEIGYHGCPSVTSIKKFISPGKLWPFEGNDEWDTHNTDYIMSGYRHYNRNTLMANQVKIMFGQIQDNLEEFVMASQISQAEALKFFIENVRIRKWEKAGIIWWNLADCWPQFSDAVVDYFMKKKLAYYYIKRVQTPICVMISEIENWEHKVIVGNDSSRDEYVSYSVEDGVTGEVIMAGRMLSRANENIEAGRIKSWDGEKRFYIIKWEIDGKHYANHYISGYAPFELAEYKAWLEKIAALPEPFQHTQLFT